MFQNEDGHTTLKLTLPGQNTLIAKKEDNPDFPRIGVYLQQPDGNEELICFAEHSGNEQMQGHEICIGAYTSDQDEPAYYAPYVKKGE